MRTDIGIIACDDAHWEPVQATIDCQSLSLLADTKNILYRTNDTDPNSEITIPSFTERIIIETKRTGIIHAADVQGFVRVGAGLRASNIKRISVSR